MSSVNSTRRRGYWKHGKQRTPEWRSWVSMRNHCYYPKNNRYHSHGGRGIKVCDRWLGESGFVNFLADMGPKPSPRHSIDRIDNNGNYEPGNCRWATPKEQANNTRRNLLLTHNGRTMPLQAWANESGVERRTLAQRIRYGWPMELALIPPKRRES